MNADFGVADDKNLVKIVRHYRRSVRIDADIGRPDALDGYLLTDTAKEALSVMARQIAGSNQRAFTWTGPYGGGKSSLALVLAAAVSADQALRDKAVELLKDIPYFSEVFSADDGDWLVVPVVGRRGSITKAIAQNLSKALGAEDKVSSEDTLVADLATEACRDGCGGVLLIVDEMGKFLEASAAGGDDVHFFQDLAETAARSDGKIVVIGILHQAFRQYASRLGIEAREEWAKVQGRFSDVSFVATGDEVVELISRAIECKIAHPEDSSAGEIIGSAISGRRPAVGRGMGTLLNRCWPLHPVTAALLGPASRRQFGQNERSVFGFLTSLEPNGFQDFLEQWDGKATYGPDKFWDYLRANLEQAILASPDGHRWAQAVEAVERTESKGGAAEEIALAKSLAIIDMFRSVSGLAADSDALHTILHGRSKADVEALLTKLSVWRVALFRKHVGAWTIYEGSDFDIDEAVAKARATFASADMKTLTVMANLHPVIAKRHYNDTGSFRWLGVSMHSVHEAERLASSYQPEGGEFGRLALVLPERQSNTQETAKALAALPISSQSPIIYGVPPNHELIADLGAELLSLRLVFEGSPELEGDSVARREVAARLSSVKGSLEEALRAAVTKAQWRLGTKQKKSNSLSTLASEMANEIFAASPRVWSELVNRDSLSANSVKARRDLLHRMIKNTFEENLGIEGFPAERGLYDTVLSSTGLHREGTDGAWRFCAPELPDQRNLIPLWTSALKLVSTRIAGTVSLRELYNLWGSRPYGVKAGLLPVLALAFMLAHAETVAVYRDGVFEPSLTDADVDEMLQDAGRFSVRWVDDDAERKRALEALSMTLKQCGFTPASDVPLEVARALVALVFSLPMWTRRTHRISKKAQAVRDILLKASDPHRLLFIDLPEVFAPNQNDYCANIQAPLQELLNAYSDMLKKADARLAQALDAEEGDDPELRVRAQYLSTMTGDLRLEGFAARLRQRDGTTKGVEEILGLAVNKPPRDWTDLDFDAALVAVADLSFAFRRAEAFVSVEGRLPGRESFAVVIGEGASSSLVTKHFEIAGRDREKVREAADQIISFLTATGLDGDLLLAALARAGTTMVKNTEVENA
ncbi:ATP-binding protein [Pseudomonas protegens]|uniref:ATP-binding protein n=1 Tax=Pseudomonas protegens TaxID=380021 RepID=UPI001C69CA89|nr:ATP-binding protein [Pseudomonas protegens]QYN03627.1 ATP-binding protein [Pseudomonas protegens]